MGPLFPKTTNGSVSSESESRRRFPPEVQDVPKISPKEVASGGTPLQVTYRNQGGPSGASDVSPGLSRSEYLVDLFLPSLLEDPIGQGRVTMQQGPLM